jgi:hypothetical protein
MDPAVKPETTGWRVDPAVKPETTERWNPAIKPEPPPIVITCAGR